MPGDHPVLARGEGWRLEIARPEHGPALCELFASVHLRSALDLTQERDPDFFALPRMHQGPFATAVGLDDDGRVVGCGTAIVRDGWYDGRQVPTGYLCDLRVAPGFRGGLHLARAYGEFMAWVSRELGAELFTTVIFDSNRAAIRALTERSDKRRDQPVYRPMTPFEMVSVQFTTRRAPPSSAVRPATAADRERLVAFLAGRARTRVLGEVLLRSHPAVLWGASSRWRFSSTTRKPFSSFSRSPAISISRSSTPCPSRSTCSVTSVFVDGFCVRRL